MTEQKQRHGCLTAFLIFMIVANSLGVLRDLFMNSGVMSNIQQLTWTSTLGIVCGVFNVICAIALFRWKKWGFWGLMASSIFGMFLTVSTGLRSVESLGVGIAVSLGALILVSLLPIAGIAILYYVLHIGKENKGWPQLD